MSEAASSASDPVPGFEALLDDLQQLRERGLGTLRHHRYLALHAACAYCDLLTGTDQEPAAIEALLGSAVERLGGGEAGDAAAYTFGLVVGTKLWSVGRRRARAAELWEVTEDRFRKSHEKTLVEQVAEGVLAVCRDQTMRRTRLQLERRHPADSRLAVQWVERFEAYFRVWTPAYKLAADLEAAIDTRLEPPSEHPPWAPESDETYDQEDQARGYARYALEAYVYFLLEVRKFITKHGGMWLFSDHKAEQRVMDAVYRISWHNPMNQDDDSWLRRTLADARHQESEHFHHLLHGSRLGQRIVGEWQDYVASCACPGHDSVQESCQVHATIAACREYCQLVDAEWYKIADWYRIGAATHDQINGLRLYGDLISRRPAEHDR